MVEQFIIQHSSGVREYVIMDDNDPSAIIIGERYFLCRLRTLLDVNRRAEQETMRVTILRERVSS